MKLNQRLTINGGVRWEPYLPMEHPFGWVSHFDQAALSQAKSAVYKNAPAGLTFPGEGLSGKSTTFGRIAQFAPRLGLVFDPKGDGKMTVRASYGIFYDNPHLFFNTRFANNPPWGAQTRSNPAGGLTNPYQGFPGGNPFPALANISPNSFFPLAGIYVNAPLDIKPTYLQQWNLSVQRQSANGCLRATISATNPRTCGRDAKRIRRSSARARRWAIPINAASLTC